MGSLDFLSVGADVGGGRAWISPKAGIEGVLVGFGLPERDGKAIRTGDLLLARVTGSFAGVGAVAGDADANVGSTVGADDIGGIRDLL
jgi:hypothetical protein